MRERGPKTWVFVAAGLFAAAAGCDQSVAEETDGGADGAGRFVTVVFDDAGHEVVLGTLATTLVEGTPVVGLQAVIEAALPGETPDGLVAGFVGADGFRPESREFCELLVPVDWETLGRGYIHPVTRDLLWDAALGFPGCMSPRDIAEIDVTRP
ncbi:MAG: hypothetical protein JXB32_13415 [Deltaproteobacteria bacterium]|nr:hypothetical protein [Deltaproteobacteria bacterium]